MLSVLLPQFELPQHMLKCPEETPCLSPGEGIFSRLLGSRDPGY